MAYITKMNLIYMQWNNEKKNVLTSFKVFYLLHLKWFEEILITLNKSLKLHKNMDIKMWLHTSIVINTFLTKHPFLGSLSLRLAKKLMFKMILRKHSIYILSIDTHLIPNRYQVIIIITGFKVYREINAVHYRNRCHIKNHVISARLFCSSLIFLELFG